MGHDALATEGSRDLRPGAGRCARRQGQLKGGLSTRARSIEQQAAWGTDTLGDTASKGGEFLSPQVRCERKATGGPTHGEVPAKPARTMWRAGTTKACVQQQMAKQSPADAWSWPIR